MLIDQLPSQLIDKVSDINPAFEAFASSDYDERDSNALES